MTPVAFRDGQFCKMRKFLQSLWTFGKRLNQGEKRCGMLKSFEINDLRAFVQVKTARFARFGVKFLLDI